jgi:hypothetical protein
MNYPTTQLTKICQELLGLKQTGIITMQLLSLIDGKKVLPSPWSPERRIIGFVQYSLKHLYPTITIDGYYGGETAHLLDLYYKVPLPKRTDTKSDPDVPVNTIYPSYSKLESFYGEIDSIPSQLISIVVPYDHYLAWDLNTKTNKVTCHKKIAEVYVSVLEDVLHTYGYDNIRKLRLNIFGGSYQKRNMRGGTKLSTHGFGIAFDYDPLNNSLREDRNTAEFARPDYREWLDAWNKTGAVSLGEIKNYDWMHFQFSKP